MAYRYESAPPVHTCAPPPAVRWCFTHHLLARRRYDGGVEKAVAPPPHRVEVPPREMNGRLFYAGRCPVCGGPLVKERGRFGLVRTSQHNIGQVRADARGY